MSFSGYLSQKKFQPSYLKKIQSEVSHFENWLIQMDIHRQHVRYQEMLQYIDYCRSMGNSQKTIALKVRCIKYYYDYLYKYLQPNPCDGWVLYSNRSALPSPLFTEIQIDKMYSSYPEQTVFDIRDKVILGLYCYQALQVGDILALQVKDILLEHMAIIVRKKSRNNARSLKIRDLQKKCIEQYLTQVWDQISKHSGKIEQFIVGAKGELNHIQYMQKAIYRNLQPRFPTFHTIRQLRASAITNWLKHYNLREVQYMAGHRYVRSTERYLISRIDDLQKSIDKTHPLA